jgi:hypothetical protein
LAIAVMYGGQCHYVSLRYVSVPQINIVLDLRSAFAHLSEVYGKF